MLAAELTARIRPYREAAVPTAAATEERFASRDRSRSMANGAEEDWKKWIDQRLIPWGLRPGEIDEDDFESPSRESIKAAGDAIRKLATKWNPPSHVVGNGEGGICILWDPASSDSYEIEIDRDGAAELRQFVDCRLQSRFPLSFRDA